jgi:hypothetical protein
LLAWDDVPGGNQTSRYGVKFQSHMYPAFNTAMHNTATIAHILAGSPAGGSWIVMMGELKTDDKNGTAWPADPGPFLQLAPHRAGDAWNNTSGYGSGSSFPPFNSIGPSVGFGAMLGWWHHTNTSWHPTSATTAFGEVNAATWPAANTHMRSDLTRYSMKASFWIVYWVSTPGNPHPRLVMREIECNNMKTKYYGWQRAGSVGFKVAGNNSGISAGEGPGSDANGRMRLGEPVRLSPEQAKQFDRLRNNQMQN